MNYSTNYLQQFASQFAIQNGVDPNFVLAQIGQESAWNPSAYNPAGPDGGAMGLGQFIQSTANAYGVNPYDPLSSIQGTVNYDSDLLNNQCNGDYLCVAQKYGTIPSSGNYTLGQQNVANAAQNANAQNPYSFNASCVAQSAASLGLTDITSCFGPQSQSDCASYDFVCKIKSSGLNLLSIIVGLILLMAGLFMLKSGSSAGETVIAARNTLRDTLAESAVSA